MRHCVSLFICCAVTFAIVTCYVGQLDWRRAKPSLVIFRNFTGVIRMTLQVKCKVNAELSSLELC